MLPIPTSFGVEKNRHGRRWPPIGGSSGHSEFDCLVGSGFSLVNRDGHQTTDHFRRWTATLPFRVPSIVTPNPLSDIRNQSSDFERAAAPRPPRQTSQWPRSIAAVHGDLLLC